MRQAEPRPERGPAKKISRAARAAPEHIPLASSRTTSIGWNVAKRGLLSSFDKAAQTLNALKSGTNSFAQMRAACS